MILSTLLLAGPAGAQQTPTPVNDDAQPSLSPDGRRVAFHSLRNGFADIYVTATDGSTAQRLTRDAGHNASPAWSPDGTMIAFHSNRGGSWQIYVMKVDGSEQRAVTEQEGDASEPGWAPDGSRLLYLSTIDSVRQVWEISLEGETARQITASAGAKNQPASAPRSDSIAFISTATGGQEIYVAALDGTGERRVTHLTDENPRRFINGLGWTPEGRLIFGANIDVHGRYWFSTDIYTLDRDGTGLERVLGGVHAHNHASLSRDGSTLAFESFRYGGRDIFVANADGIGVRNVTQTSAMSDYPSYTPDGRHIVFQSERAGHREIYRMVRDGSDVRNLTNNPEDDRAPKVSLDGTEIVFISFRDSRWGDIYTMNLDGGDVRKVTPDGFFEELNQFAIAVDFTPDRQTIVFESVPILTVGEAHWDIWRIDRDGTDARRLTDTPGTNRSSFPEVSPDGRSVLYHSNREGNSEVYRMDLDGGNKANLTNDPAGDHYPVWSPSGSEIYFSSARGGNNDIYVMNPDGSNVRRVTTGTANAAFWRPRVSPDGGELLALSNADGVTEIHRMEIDGSDRSRLTAPSGPYVDDAPLSSACQGFSSLASANWSWTRNAIAITGDCGGEYGIYVYDVEADVLERIETYVERPSSPVWSHSGNEFVFTASYGNLRDVFTLDLASGNTKRLTNDSAWGGDMSWGPADQWLAVYGPTDERWNIYRMSLDGRERVRLNRDNDAQYYNITWASGGGAYAYTATNAIMVQRTGAEDPMRVSPPRLWSVMPHWSPLGDWLVFDGGDGSGWELYLVRPDGSDLTRLTQNGPIDSNASWSPDGSRIVHKCSVDEIRTLCIVDVQTRRTRPLFKP